jgi:hypothetical protein
MKCHFIWCVLLHPEISFLSMRQGDKGTGGQGDKSCFNTALFARIIFSDLSAWANRQVRVNVPKANIGRILLYLVFP